MVKFCNHCGLEIHFPDIFTCAYCQSPYCIEHRLVEDHNCPPATAVKHVEKHHLRKEEQKLQQSKESKTLTSTNWMYSLLSTAKYFINKHHKDESAFFSDAQFNLFVQNDWESAYGYIDGTFPYYRIGIHPSLSEQNPENTRMVIIVLVHELLHAIHADWGHDKINPEERRLANLGNYFDALRNMEVLYLSGKMRFCDK